MEFEDLKKIWDTQNNEPMYAINETALHQRIHKHKNKTKLVANMNEIGIMIIATVTGGILVWDVIFDNNSMYALVGGLAFFLITLFVFFSRRNRKKNEHRFDQSMLGELDHAITNAGYIVTFARTFMWWFLLPASIFAYPNMVLHDAPWYRWVIVTGGFILSFLVVRWELNRIHLPRKKKLESLRDKLIGDREFS
ncbi:conserved membrane hypothetical protein [Imperialibacter sp. EC-SDR9]|nr:conserved membrane hypothetical protein [Imperialibacter sp. 89]VVT14992.1 conserved membrane hypothetical protein [Imperialibacter sp. EC-SDR9]